MTASDMSITDHLPIIHRAYAVLATKDVTASRPIFGKKGGTKKTMPASGWTVIFDTETFTDAGQALRFGTYQVRDNGEASQGELDQAVEQGFGYANQLRAEFLWMTSIIRNDYFKVLGFGGAERIENRIADLPKEGKTEAARAKFTKSGKDGFELETVQENELTRKFKQAHDALWAGGKRKRTTVAEAARAYNDEQLATFRARLMGLEPFQFEHFVKDLLDAMDYTDVQVTKYSGDKGVDVVAKVQFGITDITEVVQVKRTEGTITRPVIDRLRGALGYHHAIRGTIISLGTFAQGAKDGALFPGVAPITLIDGKRLVDLCVKHQVGVRRTPVEIFEIDESFFALKYQSGDADDPASVDEDIESD